MSQNNPQNDHDTGHGQVGDYGLDKNATNNSPITPRSGTNFGTVGSPSPAYVEVSDFWAPDVITIPRCSIGIVSGGSAAGGASLLGETGNLGGNNGTACQGTNFGTTGTAADFASQTSIVTGSRDITPDPRSGAGANPFGLPYVKPVL